MAVYSSSSFPHRLTERSILIVGGGAVGIAIAVHLARMGQPVTVLEGGPPDPPVNYQSFNSGPVTGHHHRGILVGRMKALGGTTRLWGGQLVPFDRGDFASTDKNGRPLWPITYDEFSKWVDRAYDLLNVSTEARDTATLWAKATEANSDFGYGLTAHMNIWLPQPDFTKMFAEDIANLDGLDIVTGAEVVNLTFADDGRVQQVEARTKGGLKLLLYPREIILANGTLEIGRLLLRTAATAPRCPYAKNRHLGRWYMDHLHGIVGELHDVNEAELQRLFDNVYYDKRKYNVKLRLSPDDRLHGMNLAVTLNPRITPRKMLNEVKYLVQRIFQGGGLATMRRSASMARIMIPLAWRYVVNRRSTSLFGSGTAIGIEVEQIPNFESRLLLAPSEPLETARVGIHWQFDGVELEAIAAMCERLKASFAERGFGRVEIDPRIEARDPIILNDFHDSSHQMGGARMAESPEYGVTDPDCRVFGAPNLSIAGAAVFPSGSFANCTLSAIALALRTAERVAMQSATHCK